MGTVMAALKHMMTTNPTAKIVMYSSMGQQALIAEAFKAGAKDFVVKPFQPQKVTEILFTAEAKPLLTSAFNLSQKAQ